LNKFISFYPILPDFLVLKGSMHAYARIGEKFSFWNAEFIYKLAISFREKETKKNRK